MASKKRKTFTASSRESKENYVSAYTLPDCQRRSEKETAKLELKVAFCVTKNFGLGTRLNMCTYGTG